MEEGIKTVINVEMSNLRETKNKGKSDIKEIMQHQEQERNPEREKVVCVKNQRKSSKRSGTEEKYNNNRSDRRKHSNENGKKEVRDRKKNKDILESLDMETGHLVE